MNDGTPSGLVWQVVESLPVSEDIKKQKGEWPAHVAARVQSMRHLHAAGIRVICYNFMPVLDWTRTDLSWRRPNGARCMRFDLIDFAAFDLHILARPGAAEDFPPEVQEVAARLFAQMTDTDRLRLVANVVFGLPGGAETLTLQDVRQHLAEYDHISAKTLQSHLIDFLTEVTRVAEALGMRLCCHPDDPPFPLLGLPRIMSTATDYARVKAAVDLHANGITLCTGSLGARPDNNPVDLMHSHGDRVHFLHLRNVTLEGMALRNSFFEDGHLQGRTDMVGLIAAVVAEERHRQAEGRSDWSIPMWPDHGQDILDDIGRQAHPGYPLSGRLKGLAELRGIHTALTHPAVRFQGCRRLPGSPCPALGP